MRRQVVGARCRPLPRSLRRPLASQVPIAAIATIVVINRHDLVHQATIFALLIGVMVLNLLTLWHTQAILKHGLAGVLPVVGWVLAVLQAALAVQMVIYSLRLIEVLHWPGA